MPVNSHLVYYVIADPKVYIQKHLSLTSIVLKKYKVAFIVRLAFTGRMPLYTGMYKSKGQVIILPNKHVQA